MTSVTHMTAGLYITQAIPDPTVSLPLAFASHFLLDAIPHNDYFYFYLGQWKYSHESPLSKGLLFLGSALIIFLAVQTADPAIALWGAALGAAPDVISAVTKRMGFRHNFFNRFHVFVHTKFDLGAFFFNLASPREEHIVNDVYSTEAMRQNFYKIRHKLATKVGWLTEMGLELIFLILLIAKIY